MHQYLLREFYSILFNYNSYINLRSIPFQLAPAKPVAGVLLAATSRSAVGRSVPAKRESFCRDRSLERTIRTNEHVENYHNKNQL